MPARRAARLDGAAGGRAVPPPLAEPLLRRGHLEKVLDQALQRRLTTLVADAGFGKSTLLASWATGRPIAWYTVTPADSDVGVIAAGIVDALSLRVPGLASAVRGLMAAGRGPDAEADEPLRAGAHAALVAEALDRHLGRDVVLVIDDFGEIGSDAAPGRFVESLARMSPPLLHLVIASRRQLPFRVERLRGQGLVLSIDGSGLAFGLEETSELLRILLGDDDPELARLLHEATGGWPATVRLGAEALASAPPAERSETLGRLLRPGGPVAAYLLEEVVARSAPEVRRLLETVRPLERFSAGVCHALGVPQAGHLLSDLSGRGLFVQELGDSGWYSLMPLLGELLEATLASSPDARLRERRILRRAATWHLRQGEWHAALACLRSAGDRRLPSFLEEQGHTLIAGGDLDAVLEAVEGIPAARRTAEIDQLEGEVRQVRGDWDGALARFERLTARGGRVAAGVAWRMGLIHHLRGDLDRALAAYQRGRPDRADPANVALLHAWWASALWLRGEVDECRRLAARALREATQAADDSALAAAHTVLAMLAAVDSDRRANDAHYLRALEHASRAADTLQMIRIRANRGSRFAEEGYYAEALTELDEAIRLADLGGFAAFRALALSNRGQVLLAQGRLDEAITELETARTLYQRMESRLVAYPLAHLGEVYRERGDTALARANFEEAIAVADAAGDQQGLVPALSGLARVIVRSEPDLAAQLAARAVAAGPVLGRGAALLAQGWVALARGDVALAGRSAEEASSLARQRRDRATLAGSIELSVRAAADPVAERDRLDEALALWRDLGNPLGVARVELALAELLPAAAAVPVAERARTQGRRLGAWRLAGNAGRLLDLLAAQPSAPVEVRSLGGFEVLRDLRSVPLSEWRSRKARDILKVLVAARGARVPREQLLDLFWPDEAPARSGPRLSVALSTIRSVLDPTKSVGADHYLGSDRGSAWLNLDHLPVDVERFLAGAQEALRQHAAGAAGARGLLAEAEAQYRGDFLGEDVYQDWATGPREEARASYQRVTRALADLAARAGEHAVAASYLRRLIERDPWDEQAHLRLVQTLVAARQHGDARRAYRTYTDRMRELDVEAATFPSEADDGAWTPEAGP